MLFRSNWPKRVRETSTNSSTAAILGLSSSPQLQFCDLMACTWGARHFFSSGSDALHRKPHRLLTYQIGAYLSRGATTKTIPRIKSEMLTSKECAPNQYRRGLIPGRSTGNTTPNTPPKNSIQPKRAMERFLSGDRKNRGQTMSKTVFRQSTRALQLSHEPLSLLILRIAQPPELVCNQRY